jgi:uncharacterized protein (DUF1800 family)
MRWTKSFIAAAVSAGSLTTSITAQTTGARLDHRELAADQQIIQALNRLTFGPRPGDAQKVRAMGLDKWIDLQLHPERINNSSFDRFASGYNILTQDQGELLAQFAEARRDRQTANRERDDSAQMSRRDRMALQQLGMRRRQFIGQLQSERVASAVASERQLQEVMTDFWLNHFNVFAGKGPPQPYYLVEYERDVIRPNALGNFRTLLEAVAKSPAMLFYLDNARSMADSSRPRLAGRGRVGIRGRRPQQARGSGLNENYGRELLELHTLGVDGGYTQQDVLNVARALTGWTIKPPPAGGGFIFRPEMHDAGEKIVLGRKLPAGRGMEDGEDVLDIVAGSPATARYIATKLVRRFVADEPPQALVDDGAAVFLKTKGDIREVLRTIVTSNELYSQRAFRSKVKSPFEVVVSAMRALNAQPDPTPRTAQAIAFLGQPIYGHQAPNGYPESGDAWMNTGAILNRINFGMAVAANRIPGLDFTALPAIDSLRNAPRQKQVDAVVALLLAGSASADTRTVLIKGENPLATTALADSVDMTMAASGNDDMMAPVDRQRRTNQRAVGRGTIPQLTGVAQIVGLALGSPEFQRR